jgi:hypothetical protein
MREKSFRRHCGRWKETHFVTFERYNEETSHFCYLAKEKNALSRRAIQILTL